MYKLGQLFYGWASVLCIGFHPQIIVQISAGVKRNSQLFKSLISDHSLGIGNKNHGYGNENEKTNNENTEPLSGDFRLNSRSYL